MATVTVFTSERTAEIEATSIVAGSINAAGHLVLQRHDGTNIDMGAVSGVQLDQGTTYEKADVFTYVGDTDPGAVPDGSVWLDTNGPTGPFASTAQQGLVELATTAETTTGTDTQRAVTPAGALAAINAAIAAIPGTRTLVLTSNSVTEGSFAASYPTGLSFMTLSSGSGWSLNSGFGMVVTQKSETDRITQTFYANASSSTATPRAWIRHGVSGGAAWTSWSQLQSLMTLNPANFAQTTNAFSGYPSGWSRLIYTTANSTNWDFSGLAGEVLTFVDGTDFAKQMFTQHVGGSGTPGVWVRTANAANGWTAWRKSIFETTGMIKAAASGTLVITPSAPNTPTSVAVTFPAGRFTATPNVQICALTTVPGSQVTGVAANNPSSTGFDAYVTRTNTTNTTLSWLAIQLY